MKREHAQKKEKHALTWSKYALFLAMATKWESEFIDKSAKLTKFASELNDYASYMVELKEAKEKTKVDLEASNCKVAELKKAKHELSAMFKQLTLSVEIEYGLAMDSFKRREKKRSLGEYYNQILDIPVTPQYEPAYSLGGDME